MYLSATQTYIFTMRPCNGFKISALYIGVDSWHLSSVGKFYFSLENRHWEQQTGKWPHPSLSGRWHQDQCPYSEIILICQVGACCRYKNQALIELCHCAGLPITVQSEHPARGGRRLLSGIQLVLCSAPSVPQPVVQSRRRPLLGPSLGWKRLLPLSHLRHY